MKEKLLLLSARVRPVAFTLAAAALGGLASAQTAPATGLDFTSVKDEGIATMGRVGGLGVLLLATSIGITVGFRYAHKWLKG